MTSRNQVLRLATLDYTRIKPSKGWLMIMCYSELNILKGNVRLGFNSTKDSLLENAVEEMIMTIDRFRSCKKLGLGKDGQPSLNQLLSFFLISIPFWSICYRSSMSR